MAVHQCHQMMMAMAMAGMAGIITIGTNTPEGTKINPLPPTLQQDAKRKMAHMHKSSYSSTLGY